MRRLAMLLISLLCTDALAEYCGEQRNLALVNGEIYSMDERNTVHHSLLIKGGVFVALDDHDYADQDCTDVIDLQGRTVIPGLIDNHVHFIRIQNRPGYDTRAIETTFTHDELFEVIRQRAAEVPEGELISAIGGIRQWQWDEGRFPSMQALDAAAPNHMVYLSEHGFGPGQVNSAARERLIAAGVAVGYDGSVGAREATADAFSALSASIDDAHRTRQLKDLIARANEMGLTGVMDMSGSIPGVGFLDQRTGYNPIISLDRSGQLNLRTRLYFPTIDPDANLGMLQGRLDNTFHHFGSDMLKAIGVGEWSVERSLFNEKPLGEIAVEAQRRMASNGWTYHQHLHTAEELDAHLDVWESLDDEYDLSELRWTPGHLSGLTPALIERIVNLGLGLGAHGQPYFRLAEEGQPFSGRSTGGPPWRDIVESDAVAKAAGSDGARISPLSPWLIIYYMVTGKNSAGETTNAAQTISRLQAVRLYTSSDQGWFTKEDDKLGGIGVGRYGDLVVLSKDVFDPNVVSDADIRKMTSSLTVVGGRIVHSDGSLSD